MTVEERMNDILDKKLDGIELTDLEKDFLDSFEYGTEEEVNKKFSLITYENDGFIFEVKEIKDYGDKIEYIGFLSYTNYIFDAVISFNSTTLEIDYNCVYKSIEIIDVLDDEEIVLFHVFVMELTLKLFQ